MKIDKTTRIALALTLALVACGNAPKKNGATGGEGGDETGGAGDGTGGSKPSSTTGGSTGTGGATPSTGGAPGTGGTTESPDAATSTGGSGGSGGDEGADAAPPPPADGGGPVGAGHPGALAWYEAEAPANMLFGGSSIGNCGAGTCASQGAIKEGLECCSAGKKVSQLLRGKGGVTFMGVMAPSDGMYDVTWWFHCGKNDNFGDTGCGGAPHTPAGCRPHVFELNGAKFPKVYHFPCFPGSWGEIHASTVTFPLKAGMNSIKVQATAGRDAADLDAIEIFPAGKGFPPTIAGTDK